MPPGQMPASTNHQRDNDRRPKVWKSFFRTAILNSQPASED
jgi:hypothetical protein